MCNANPAFTSLSVKSLIFTLFNVAVSVSSIGTQENGIPVSEGSSLFKGMKLDIHWISYNLALITLKLLHLAGIER